MQDVNNDMDDLFRKAAEKYPLKTDGADWEKVLAGLQDTSMPAAEEKEKRKRRALWLFLLLPLGLLWMMYYKEDHSSAQQTNATQQSTKNGINNNDKQAPASDFTQPHFDVKNKSDAKTSALSDKEKNGSDTYNTGNNNTSLIDDSKIDFHEKKSSARIVARSFFSGHKESDSHYRQALLQKNTSGVKDNKNNLPALQPAVSSYRIDKTIPGNKKEETTETITQGEADSPASNNTKDSSANNNTSSENKSKMIKAKPHVQKGFYAGLMASFDVSTIKLQRINKTGHGFELLMGYRFSKRLSAESGINWTDKKYYSIGKYFDKTKTGIPTESKIIYTNGSCAMLEIPATVKYDFAQKKKSNWFATAGLSSYIMKDETYSYYANHSGNYYNATKKYSHSGSNLFSVAGLSVGYQLQLNKHLSLRAEPYIKMPLSGIGIAKMPITSTGISAGFTRSF